MKRLFAFAAAAVAVAVFGAMTANAAYAQKPGVKPGMKMNTMAGKDKVVYCCKECKMCWSEATAKKMGMKDKMGHTLTKSAGYPSGYMNAENVYVCKQCKTFYSASAAKKMGMKDAMGHKLEHITEIPDGYKKGTAPKVGGKMGGKMGGKKP